MGTTLNVDVGVDVGVDVDAKMRSYVHGSVDVGIPTSTRACVCVCA
jgi:hypothetical protein